MEAIEITKESYVKWRGNYGNVPYLSFQAGIHLQRQP